MKRFLSVLTALSIFGSQTAFAQISSTQTSEESDITIDVTLPEKYIEDYYSLYVLNPGKTKADLDMKDGSAIQFYHQGEYPENGTSVSFRINRDLYDASLTPHFKVLLRAGDYSEEYEFSAYSKDIRNALISEVNSKSEAQIGTVADRVADVFNVKVADYNNISDKNKLARTLYNLFGSDAATTDNIADYMYNAIMITGAETGEIDMVNSDGVIYNEIIGVDEDLFGLLSKIKDVNGINKALKEEKYSSISELNEKITEEIILSAVYDNKQLGYGHVSKIVEEFSDYFEKRGLNISKYNSSDKDSNAQNILSRGRVSFEALVTALGSSSQVIGSVSDSSSSSGGSSSGSMVAGGKIQTTTAAVEGFNDLSQAEWARAKVMSLKSKGIVSGDGGNFYPNNHITRAELTKMVVDALGINAESDVSFADVSAGSWYESYIKRGAGASVIYGDGTNFFPNDNIKRQDIAAICYRALAYKGINLSDTGYKMNFTDLGDISDYAKESVESLYQYGIINGNDTNEFLPQNNATRAEAAVIIWGIVNGAENGFSAQKVAKKDNGSVNEEVRINENLEHGTFLMVRAGMVAAENAGNPDRNVTRGEFAKIIAKYANKESVTSEENFYDDVTGDTPYAGYINGMTSLGYINAKSGRVYEPEKNVTLNEAKIAILNVLGYANALSDESEYLKTASELGIESQIPCGGDEAVTMGGILSLFESSLEADVMKLEVSGTDMKLVKGSDFLESFYGIKLSKGVMNGNNITNYNTNITPKKYTVLINSVEYEIDDDLYFMNDYLGYYMQVAYYEEDNKVVGFKELKNSELVISDTEISGYADGRVYYAEDGENKERSIKIPSDAIIVYNGVVEKSYSEDMFDIASGSIEFVGGNTDEYNVVKIYDYDTIVSNGASSENNKVYSMNTSTIYSLEDYDNVIIRTSSGTLKHVGDIKGGNVLSVAESKDKRNIIINISDSIVNGKISKINNTDLICVVDGTEYEFLNSAGLTSDMIGNGGKFYLDYKGRVAWAQITSASDMRYAYLVKAGYDDSVGGMFFKIFNDKGEMEMLSQDAEVKIDGDKVTAENISDYFLYTAEGTLTDKMQPQLIKYKQGSDGVIKEIDTAFKGVNENSSSLSVNLDAYTKYRQFAARTNRLVDLTSNQEAGLYNAMRLGESTVIFKVPESSKIAEATDDDYSLVPLTAMIEGKILAGPVLAYDTDFENADLVGALTYTNARTESGLKAEMAFLVTRVTESINADNEIVPSVVGYDYQTKKETTLTSYHKQNVFENVKPGDVIRYVLDENGNAEEITIDLELKTAVMGLEVIPWVNGNTGMGSGNIWAAYQYGVLTHKNGNYINFADKIKTVDGKLQRGGSTYDVQNADVIVFNTKTCTMNKVSPDELGEYLYGVNPQARVYIYTSFTLLQNIIVYI